MFPILLYSFFPSIITTRKTVEKHLNFSYVFIGFENIIYIGLALCSKKLRNLFCSSVKSHKGIKMQVDSFLKLWMKQECV